MTTRSENNGMFGLNYVPYELVGFVVFWALSLAVGFVLLMLVYSLWITGITKFRDWLWEDKNPSKGEKPEGWKLPTAFVVHIIWCVSKLKSPICWRWKTYKSEYLDE